MALSSSSISSTRSRLLPMVAAATSSSFSRCYSVARKPIISAASSAWLERRFLQPKVPIGLSKPVFCNNILAAGRAFASVSINDRTIYEFTVKDISGNDVDLSIYKGKVLLFVNVASECGMTKRNYTELAELYRRYKDKGFEVLAFPCNQFGAQEPGTNEQIKEFACTNFKVEFPIFGKVDVNGPNAAPLYQYLREARKELLSDEVKWNFGKFLVNRNGKPVKRYAPTQNPSQIEGDIVKYLAM